LEKILQFHTVQSRKRAEEDGRPPTPEFFLEDIRAIPESFAMRPSRQSGASVYGFDQLDVLRLAQDHGAVEAFLFPHGVVPPSLGHITQNFLTPPNDPFLKVVEKFHEERGHKLDRGPVTLSR
jgi:hypothetical protein